MKNTKKVDSYFIMLIACALLGMAVSMLKNELTESQWLQQSTELKKGAGHVG